MSTDRNEREAAAQAALITHEEWAARLEIKLLGQLRSKAHDEGHAHIAALMVRRRPGNMSDLDAAYQQLRLAHAAARAGLRPAADAHIAAAECYRRRAELAR